MHKILCFISLLSAVLCKSQKLTDYELSGFIQKKGDSLYKARGVPAIFVGLFNGSRQFYSFGYAAPKTKVRFDSATVFEAGSITKTFTAYILESILQAKGISDTTGILPYLPDSVQKNTALSSITFLSLMNHTSGLPRLPENLPLNSIAPYDDYTDNDLFAYLKTCVPAKDGKSNYSNLGMGLAGVLAQRITRADFTTLLHRYVFNEFGMEDALNKKAKKAQGYFEEKPQPFWNMNSLAPAGGVKCSARDLLNYVQTLSRLQAVESLKGNVIKRLLEPTATVTPTINICRAWHTFQQKDKAVVYWHNGGTYGFSTFVAFVKNTEQAVVVIVNQFNKNDVSDGLGMMIMKKMLE